MQTWKLQGRENPDTSARAETTNAELCEAKCDSDSKSGGQRVIVPFRVSLMISIVATIVILAKVY